MWVEEWFLPAVVTLFGLIFGSFANVVILRLPKGESVVAPASRCPKCSTRIKWYDNVPVLAWLWLRGRCRACGQPISWRYPVVEALSAALFLAVHMRYGLSWLALEYTIFCWSLLVVSVIDLDHMILPDVFTLSGIVIGLLGAALNPDRQFLPALYGVLMGGGFLWFIAYFYFLWRKEEGMGGGDIKLLGWIGAVLSWTSIPFVILVSSLLGSVVGISYALKTRAGLKSTIPFGPFLALAAILYLLGGEQLGQWYIGLFIPDLDPVN
jgi:leader peptidase (prepilin peptidase)/N-methyltransferase